QCRTRPPLAPCPLRWWHPPGAVVPTHAPLRPHERLLHAAPSAVRGTRPRPHRPRLQDLARSRAECPGAAAGGRDPRGVPRPRRRRKQARRPGADAVRRPAAGQDLRRAAAAALRLVRAGRRDRRAGAPDDPDPAAQDHRDGVRNRTSHRDSRGDGVQFRGEQRRHLPRSAAARATALARPPVVHAGVRRRRDRQYRHRQEPVRHAHAMDRRRRDRCGHRRGVELRGVGDAGVARALTSPLAWLAALTVIRLVVAGVTQLVPDEAYYWVFSRALAPGYLDHPPMVALWIRAGTLIAGDGALGVRLLGPLSVALGSMLLADAGERLLGRGAGVTAALLLNATLFVGA